MPMVVEERNMFSDPQLTNYAIPINTIGIMGNGLALYFKKKNGLINRAYIESIKNGTLERDKYFWCGQAEANYVGIITKHDWREGSQLEWIIESLLSFDKDKLHSHDSALGHGMDYLLCPALGCGKGGLNWIEIEPILKEKLKDTQVEYIFCIESSRRPDAFYSKEENGYYFFKGESILGVVGHYPFTIENKTYPDVKTFIYSKIVELYKEEVDESVNEKAVALLKECLRTGSILPNGKHYKNVIEELTNIAKVQQYKEIPLFKETIEELKKKELIPIYTGEHFKHLLGTGLSISDEEVVDDESWFGELRLSNILSQF